MYNTYKKHMRVAGCFIFCKCNKCNIIKNRGTGQLYLYVIDRTFFLCTYRTFFYTIMYTQPQNFKQEYYFSRHLFCFISILIRIEDHSKFLFLSFIFRILHILCKTVLRIVHTVLHCSCVSHLVIYLPTEPAFCTHSSQIAHANTTLSTCKVYMSNAHVNQFDIEASSKRRRCGVCTANDEIRRSL
jgi:hypothetical protein